MDSDKFGIKFHKQFDKSAWSAWSAWSECSVRSAWRVCGECGVGLGGVC